MKKIMRSTLAIIDRHRSEIEQKQSLHKLKREEAMLKAMRV